MNLRRLACRFALIKSYCFLRDRCSKAQPGEDGAWSYRLLSVTKTVWAAGLFPASWVQARSLTRPNEVLVACYAPEVGLVRRDYYSGDGTQISAQLQSMSVVGQNALPQDIVA